MHIPVLQAPEPCSLLSFCLPFAAASSHRVAAASASVRQCGNRKSLPLRFQGRSCRRERTRTTRHRCSAAVPWGAVGPNLRRTWRQRSWTQRLPPKHELTTRQTKQRSSCSFLVREGAHTDACETLQCFDGSLPPPSCRGSLLRALEAPVHCRSSHLQVPANRGRAPSSSK